MHPRAGVIVLLVIAVRLSAPTPAYAQAPPEPPGPYVIDVHGATSGLPSTDFFPPVPRGTLVPSRGFGFDVGGHVYTRKFGAARVGLGASFVWARGTASTVPTAPAAGSRTGSTAAPALPDVESRLTAIAPQVSLNFGTADGWSYISAGVGRGSVETRSIPRGTGATMGVPGTDATTGVPGTDATVSLPETRSSGGVMSINMGGGARWFLGRHVAFGFDVRFHRLSPGSGGADSPGTPRATFFVASAGLSLR